MPISADQLERQLAQVDVLKPVYLIAGDEPLLVMEAVDALRQRARALGYSEREVLDVESGFDWNDLARSGASMSLFASRRIIELRLPTGKAGTDGAAAIGEYCNNPGSDAVLIIQALQWTKAHVVKWVQAIDRAGAFIQIKTIYREELPGWISQRARSRSVQLSNEAVQLLAERVEGNLLAAAQEIDKLVLLAPGQRIDADTLLELVADNARYNVFALVDAALAGEVSRVRHVLAGLRSEGDQVAGLTGWLVSSLQTLLKHCDVAERQREQQLKADRIFGGRLKSFLAALKRGDRRFWEQRLAEVALVDRASKGRAGGDAFLLMERALLRCAHGPFADQTVTRSR